MTVTLDLDQDIEAALLLESRAAGLTPEHFLQRLVRDRVGRPTPRAMEPQARETGMVWEDGLFVYRTGRPLPTWVVDDAIHAVREERSRKILGDAA